MTFYTEQQRAMQERLESQPLAEALEASIVADEIAPPHAEFIATRDFFFLSTVSGRGEPTVSHKGGGVGCVQVIDTKTLAFPAYDGNGMYLTLGNIADTGKMGLLFMDFETPHRVRVQATGEVSFEARELDRFPGAVAVVRASVDQVFVNCARYIHKYSRVSDAKHVPDSQGNAPLAAWKRIEDLQNVLPERDTARVAAEGGLIGNDEYARLLSKGET